MDEEGEEEGICRTSRSGPSGPRGGGWLGRGCQADRVGNSIPSPTGASLLPRVHENCLGVLGSPAPHHPTEAELWGRTPPPTTTTIPVPPQLSGHRMRGWEMLLAGLGCPEPAPNHGVHPWGGCCPRLLAWGGGELPSLAPIKSPWYLYPVPLLLLAPAGTPNPATELSLGWGLWGERPPRMARAVPEVFGPPHHERGLGTSLQPAGASAV